MNTSSAPPRIPVLTASTLLLAASMPARELVQHGDFEPPQWLNEWADQPGGARTVPGLRGSAAAALLSRERDVIAQKFEEPSARFRVSVDFASLAPGVGQSGFDLILRTPDDRPLLELRVTSTGSVEAWDGAAKQRVEVLPPGSVSFSKALVAANGRAPNTSDLTTYRLEVHVDLLSENPHYTLGVSAPNQVVVERLSAASVFSNAPKAGTTAGSLRLGSQRGWAPYVVDNIEVQPTP